MISQARKYRLRKLLPKLLISVGVVLLIPACIFLLLFVVNRFSLVVELRGDREMTLEWGEVFSDPGVDVKLVGTWIFKDGLPVDAEVISGGDLNPANPGSYIITYTAESFSQEASAERVVHIMDTQAPVITLTSVPEYYTIPGDPYTEEGYSAWDNYDGDLTDQVEWEEKDGFITYRVSDSSGNCTCVSRKIRYLDPIPPEILLAGDETVYVDAGTQFMDTGWTATDNCDGDLSDRVMVSGNVDRYLSGTYQLVYTVEDESGNTASATRTVIVVPKPQQDTVTPSGRVIYLTFDDGPSAHTEELLEVLKEYNIKATFFVINSDYVDMIEQIAQEGHSIGIHSVTHDYAEIYASADDYFNDLLSMQDIICRECGVTTYLMRFPGGSSNTVSRFNPGIMTYLTQAVEDAGFRYFDWNVDSNDAGGAGSAEEVFENVTSGAENRSVSIVLQHDTKDFSVEAVEMIISWGIANGYTFLPLDMTSPTAHHGVNN